MTSPLRFFRFRFSLRSYMLLVGVLGIAIFPLAKEWRVVSGERAALKHLPPSADAEWLDHPSPVSRAIAPLLRRFEPNAGKRVQVLHLSHPGKIPIQRLAAFRWLERIELTNNVELVLPNDDPPLRIPSVRTVVVRHANLKSGLHDLNFLDHFPNLQSLALRQVLATPKAMQRIEDSPTIESLELYTVWAETYYQPWSKPLDLSGMPQLRRLKLDNTLAQRQPKLINSARGLQVLIVEMWGSDAQAVFPDLDLPDLRVAELQSIVLHEEDLLALARQPRLTDLTLVCNDVQAPAFQHLKDSPLESLAIRKHRLSDVTIDQISKIRALRRLDLTFGVANLGRLKMLNDLPQIEVLELPAAVAKQTLPKLRAKVEYAK